MGTFKKRGSLMLVVSALSMVVGGCTTHLADFPMLSTKYVDLSGVKLGDHQKGEDCVNLFLLFPDKDPTRFPDLRTAMDRAIEKGKGDMLIDLKVAAVSWTAVLGGQACYVVEGTVAQTAVYKP